ncbi:hypothetical protein ACTFSO_11915 [Bacillus cereus group sp. MYBK120-1]|uniref:hypothetical protein n=1 Tax=Bacillus cereus group sp. MYBK120-1 TaxID=3450691 RepID=UPI003F78B318
MSIKDRLELINTPDDVFETAGDLLEKGHEVVGTLSEYSPYLNVANKWMNKRRENKCKEFLQGLGMKVLSQEELTTDDLKKIDKLLKKNVNRLLVLDILEEATKTVSDTASRLLGIIAGQVMNEEKKFEYNEWVLVNGLKNMNEWDLENLKKIYLYFDSNPDRKSTNSTSVYLYFSPQHSENTVDSIRKELEGDEEYQMFRSSLMRMNSLQVLGTGEMTFDDDGTTVTSNKVGYEIYKLLNLLG